MKSLAVGVNPATKLAVSAITAPNSGDIPLSAWHFTHKHSWQSLFNEYLTNIHDDGDREYLRITLTTIYDTPTTFGTLLHFTRGAKREKNEAY